MRLMVFWLLTLAPALSCANDEELHSAEDYLRKGYQVMTDTDDLGIGFMLGPVALLGLLLLYQRFLGRRPGKSSS